MAYTEVPLLNDGDPFYNADQVNTWIKNDFAATMQHNVQAKGDLFPATGAQAGTRLAVGINGQTLTADSTQATGMKWDYRAGEKQVTAKGDLFAGSAADTLTRVPAASANNMVLVADSTQAAGVKWQYPKELELATSPGQLIAGNGAGIAVQAGGSYNGAFAVLKADSSATGGVVYAFHPAVVGDGLFVATGADSVTNIGNPGLGQYLVADSTQPAGVRWGGMAGFSAIGSTGDYQNFPSSTYREVESNGYLFRTGVGGTYPNGVSIWYFEPAESGYYLIVFSNAGRFADTWTINQASEIFITVDSVVSHCISSWRAETSTNMLSEHPFCVGIVFASAGQTITVSLWHNNASAIDYYRADIGIIRIR